MKKIFILLLVISILIIPAVSAKSGHMKLLAVQETESGIEGGIADLYLEVKPGSGRVFLETFPLSKTDTQMSTRFAKSIACDALDRDCDDVDFFYTIMADSPIIAGPSAGSSIAVLTVAVLEGLKLDESLATTGTINSGGLIGPVGGLKAKVEAAKKIRLKKVLIPSGEIIARVGNATVDLQNLSEALDIEIMEVSTLSEAVRQFTGKELAQKYKKIDISEYYADTMKLLAKGLCDRSNRLRAEALKLNYPANVTAIKENAKNFTAKGREAFERQAFYSSASYCFGANIEYSTLILISKNLTKEELLDNISSVKIGISDLRSKVDAAEKKTITDLESYMVVKERLAEAEESAGQALDMLNKTNRTERVARVLAYASERLNSAHSWATFMGKGGKEINIDRDVLKKSCQSKISEADERMQYVELYFPGTLAHVKDEVDKASEELSKGNYEICLSTASKAKADVDMVLSVFGVDSEQYENIAGRKLEIVKNNIAEQASKGVFPILSYSYYEYANSLKDTDIFSALIYSEYALELSDLDIYFKESNGKRINFGIDRRLVSVFLAGVLIGVIASFFVRGSAARKSKRKPSRR
ncbi:hypothetical protein HY637_00525 [Candidatus Woesearchaeota archaeon]|nr:hypothetical protein [Candidatus Woesearchaeota archaeon]